jgi:hypothetical protein
MPNHLINKLAYANDRKKTKLTVIDTFLHDESTNTNCSAKCSNTIEKSCSHIVLLLSLFPFSSKAWFSQRCHPPTAYEKGTNLSKLDTHRNKEVFLCVSYLSETTQYMHEVDSHLLRWCSTATQQSRKKNSQHIPKRFGKKSGTFQKRVAQAKIKQKVA